MKIKKLFGKTYFIFNKNKSTQTVFKQIENVKNQNPVYLVHTKKRKIAYQEGDRK